MLSYLLLATLNFCAVIALSWQSDKVPFNYFTISSATLDIPLIASIIIGLLARTPVGAIFFSGLLLNVYIYALDLSPIYMMNATIVQPFIALVVQRIKSRIRGETLAGGIKSKATLYRIAPSIPKLNWLWTLRAHRIVNKLTSIIEVVTLVVVVVTPFIASPTGMITALLMVLLAWSAFLLFVVGGILSLEITARFLAALWRTDIPAALEEEIFDLCMKTAVKTAQLPSSISKWAQDGFSENIPPKSDNSKSVTPPTTPKDMA